MKELAPKGKDGCHLGIGDIVDIYWQDETLDRATILTIDKLLNADEIRIFDAKVLWHSGSIGLASTAAMVLVSKASGDKNVY